MNRKRKFLFLFSGMTILVVPLITTVLISKAYLLAIVYTGFYLFISYILYLRYIRGVRPKYPLASPVKDQDIYFPRSNIPRPIYQDYREHPEFFEKKKKREEKSF